MTNFEALHGIMSADYQAQAITREKDIDFDSNNYGNPNIKISIQKELYAVEQKFDFCYNPLYLYKGADSKSELVSIRKIIGFEKENPTRSAGREVDIYRNIVADIEWRRTLMRKLKNVEAIEHFKKCKTPIELTIESIYYREHIVEFYSEVANKDVRLYSQKNYTDASLAIIIDKRLQRYKSSFKAELNESKSKRAFILKRIAKIESSFISHFSDPDLSIYYEGYNQENIYQYIDYLPFRNDIYGESYKKGSNEKYFKHPEPLVSVISVYNELVGGISENKPFSYKEIIEAPNDAILFFHTLNHYKEFPYEQLSKSSQKGFDKVLIFDIDEYRHEEAMTESLILDVCFWKWLKKELEEFEKTNPIIEPEVKTKPKIQVESEEKNEIAPSRKRLKWNGNKNTLADIFYQLQNMYNDENKPYLEASSTELQNFLKENFNVFENTTIKTIEGYFTKEEKRPQLAKNKITIEIKKDE